jgi:hypothetical protein
LRHQPSRDEREEGAEQCERGPRHEPADERANAECRDRGEDEGQHRVGGVRVRERAEQPENPRDRDVRDGIRCERLADAVAVPHTPGGDRDHAHVDQRVAHAGA